MSTSFFNQYVPGCQPGREQNLFVSHSKHLYLTGKDLQLRSQKKELDPRLPGNRCMLRRLVLLDVDTGVLYGEMHLLDGRKDLAGFLARAWHVKPNCPMRGLPRQLNVPKSLWNDGELREDLRRLQGWGGFEVGDLPGGFAAGVHAVKQFEREVEDLLWRGNDQYAPDFRLLTMGSGVLSMQAAAFACHTWRERWERVPPPPDEFFRNVDLLWDPMGAWRSGDHKVVLDGIPKPAVNGNGEHSQG